MARPALSTLASGIKDLRFLTSDAVRGALQQACAEHPDVAQFHQIGTSEGGRPVDAVTLGDGARHVSVVAGAHADEPVGPETLRLLVLATLHHRERFAELFRRYRFVIVPHVNPDGEARNASWTARWPDVNAYIADVHREKPGRDVEFGYPDMRPENRAVSAYLREHAPFVLHLSLHGMGFAEGAMLLIDPRWVPKAGPMMSGYRSALRGAGLPLHDHDRGGEKGFDYIAPGFSTTPRGTAMRAHFQSLGDEETAALFRDSSMEFVASLGGYPLSLVTEIPLFLIGNRTGSRPRYPAAYLRWRELLPELKLMLTRGESISSHVEEYGIRPVPVGTAMRLQMHAIELGLDAVERYGGAPVV